jgi:predicted kinase
MNDTSIQEVQAQLLTVVEANRLLREQLRVADVAFNHLTKAYQDAGEAAFATAAELLSQRNAAMERVIGGSCINGTYLDELDPEAGRDVCPIVPECGAMCEILTGTEKQEAKETND